MRHLIVASLYITIHAVLVSSFQYLLVDTRLRIHYDCPLLLLMLGSQIPQRALNIGIEGLHSNDSLYLSEVVTQLGVVLVLHCAHEETYLNLLLASGMDLGIQMVDLLDPVFLVN